MSGQPVGLVPHRGMRFCGVRPVSRGSGRLRALQRSAPAQSGGHPVEEDRDDDHGQTGFDAEAVKVPDRSGIGSADELTRTDP